MYQPPVYIPTSSPAKAYQTEAPAPAPAYEPSPPRFGSNYEQPIYYQRPKPTTTTAVPVYKYSVQTTTTTTTTTAAPTTYATATASPSYSAPEAAAPVEQNYAQPSLSFNNPGSSGYIFPQQSFYQASPSPNPFAYQPSPSPTPYPSYSPAPAAYQPSPSPPAYGQYQQPSFGYQPFTAFTAFKTPAPAVAATAAPAYASTAAPAYASTAAPIPRYGYSIKTPEAVTATPAPIVEAFVEEIDLRTALDDNQRVYGAPDAGTVSDAVDLRTGFEEEELAAVEPVQAYEVGQAQSAVENFVDAKTADVIDLRTAGSQESEVRKKNDISSIHFRFFFFIIL